MRVLIVIDDLRRAGAQRVILQEIQALHPHTMEFLGVALAEIPEPSFVGELERAGVTLEYISGRGLMDPRRVVSLMRLMRRQHPDLVHTHLSYANILGGIAARVAGYPVVATLHNIDTNQQRWPRAKRLIEGMVVRRCAAASVLVSEVSRLSTSRNFGLDIDRTVIVPNATDAITTRLSATFDRELKRGELGARPGEHLVCSVARLEPSKGHRFLLEALAVLTSRQANRPIRLVLIGAGPEERRVRALAAELGVGDRVVLLGAREDVSELMAASDLFVLPSLNEGLSQALLEAMALSIPVVATNVGGTSEVLQPGRTGWCVRPAQPLALADAIQQALAAPALARSYARAAHILVTQRFSLAMHVARLQSVYQTVVSG
jgi:glycosyltransferase involved in cell wall biosynthesis